MICALDIDDHLSANMQTAEESRLVLEAEYSGHSRKKMPKCLVVETTKTNIQIWQFYKF